MDEHYRWLMMFSQHNQTPRVSTSNESAGMMAGSNTYRQHNSSTTGPGNQASPSTDAATKSEIKPKMIKRVAAQHEIAILRDKEGMEAKAKRLCQQKVKEHGLDMEILDAEYQMYAFCLTSMMNLN